MIKKNSKYYFLYLFTVLIIFTLDRLSKLYIINESEKFGDINISISNFLSLILIWNKGIGFGLFSYDSSVFYNLITSLIILINLIIIYLVVTSDFLRSFFYVIILGGSLGNLFDRLYYNAVPDFIDLNYAGYHWFVFNVADIFITLGILCLILNEFINYNSKNEKN